MLTKSKYALPLWHPSRWNGPIHRHLESNDGQGRLQRISSSCQSAALLLCPNRRMKWHLQGHPLQCCIKKRTKPEILIGNKQHRTFYKFMQMCHKQLDVRLRGIPKVEERYGITRSCPQVIGLCLQKRVLPVISRARASIPSFRVVIRAPRHALVGDHHLDTDRACLLSFYDVLPHAR